MKRYCREPHARYSDYLAEYLNSGFKVRQIGNTYNAVSNQMFASRVSQPMLRVLLGLQPLTTTAYPLRVLRLVGLWQQFQQANMSVQRLGDLMNAPPEPYSIIPSRLREGKGEIVIEGLSFRYAEDLPFLYQDFNLKVAPGKVVAIMGPSGSGKSTLTKLLQGFYVPSGGTIKIDGTDIRYLSANELRHNFGVVPQETILFSGTLYDNLLMANPHATFDQIVHVCRMAEIHTAIEQLPKGYQTEIGERGVGLSGGQKQRLAIARALLKQPRILIFDEATSSLDQTTAEQCELHTISLSGETVVDSPTLAVLRRHHQSAQGQGVDAVHYPCSAEEPAGG